MTGADGFVGSHLVQGLAKNHQVTAISRRPEADRNSTLADLPNVKIIEADLVQGLSLSAEVDVVVHAAARTPAPGVNASDYVAGNIDTTLNVIDWAVRAQAKLLVYLSAISVYGRIETAVVDEKTPIREPSVYGMTKYIGEQLLADVAETLPSVILRLPVVVGPDMNTGWLFRTHQTVAQGQLLDIYNGDSPYNMVEISDVLDLVSLGAQRELSGSNVFTVGCLEPLSIRQLVESMKGHLKSISKIRETSTSDQGYVVSTEKIRRILGFQPVKAEIILAEYLEDSSRRGPMAIS